MEVIFEHEFIIRPQPKQSVRSGKGRFFIDPKKKKYVEDIKQEAQIFYGSEPTELPVCLDVVFYFNHKTKKGYHASRPDIDNLLKPLKDALSGIVYKDDSQICKIFAQKRYSKEARIIIKIATINKES